MRPEILASRRAFLRYAFAGGVGALALPLLESVLGSREFARASAADPGLPKCFGIWFWGCGVQADTWTPADAGAAWSVPTSWALSPIATSDLRQKVSVVSNLALPYGSSFLDKFPHVWGQPLMLTGNNFGQQPTACVQTSTADQIAARALSSAPSVVAAVNLRPSDNHTQVEPNLSWISKTDQPNGCADSFPATTQRDPAALFASFFGEPVAQAERAAKSSILDLASGQIRRLQSTASAADRARLEAHFDGLRQLETQLAQRGAPCRPVPDGMLATPASVDDISDAGMRQRHRTFAQVLALGLACGVRRSFSLSFTGAGDQTPMPSQTGAWARTGIHGLCHSATGDPRVAGEAEVQSNIQAALRFQMENFVAFLEVMDGMKEVDGSSLLDRSVLLATTELWTNTGASHSYERQPCIVAGGSGTALRLGEHLVLPGGTDARRLTLTLLQAAAPGIQALGPVNTPLTEIIRA